MMTVDGQHRRKSELRRSKLCPGSAFPGGGMIRVRVDVGVRVRVSNLLGSV